MLGTHQHAVRDSISPMLCQTRLSHQALKTGVSPYLQFNPSHKKLCMPPAAAAGAGGSEPAASTQQRPINPASVSLAAGCVSLIAAGAVPVHDVAFSFIWPVYVAAINKFRFNSNATQQHRPFVPLVDESWVRRYAAAAAVIAILLPAAVCALNRSNPGVLALVGPHLYLTTAQIVCEFLTGGPHVAMLPRMLVPIGFNTYRMWTLSVWVGAAAAAGAPLWHVGLAAGNLLFWGYNLFVFLLLNMLPRYLDPAKCAA